MEKNSELLSSEQIRTLRAKLKIELLRRGGIGSVYGFGQQDYDIDPVINNPATTVQYDNTLGLVRVIKPKVQTFSNEELENQFNINNLNIVEGNLSSSTDNSFVIDKQIPNGGFQIPTANYILNDCQGKTLTFQCNFNTTDKYGKVRVYGYTSLNEEIILYEDYQAVANEPIIINQTLEDLIYNSIEIKFDSVAIADMAVTNVFINLSQSAEQPENPDDPNYEIEWLFTTNPEKLTKNIHEFTAEEYEEVVNLLETMDNYYTQYGAYNRPESTLGCNSSCTGLCTNSCYGTCSTTCTSTSSEGTSWPKGQLTGTQPQPTSYGNGTPGKDGNKYNGPKSPTQSKGDTTKQTNGCSACNNSCSYLCVSNCGGTCFGECADMCRSGCASQCVGNCSEYCVGNCLGTCRNDCASNCANGCIASCATNCSGACTGCGAQCSSACGGGCTNACTGCTGNCSGTCYTDCNTTCTMGCTNTCGNNCTNGCFNSCTTYCNDNCTANCTVNCTTNCQGQCQISCTTNCTATCQNTCVGIAS